ncbi:MAG: hypothetical protein ACD_75C01708G0004 [uncultured bacterium]|nr:MAG: hypothetical protein ACD_75C01708G0004 [uncultured bacterium]
MIRVARASFVFSQIRYPVKAKRVRMLLTGTAKAIPAKLPAVLSSVMSEETTVPGWVVRKKFRGRVRIWLYRALRIAVMARSPITAWR